MIGEGSIAEDLSQNRKPDTYYIFMSILFHEREREREREDSRIRYIIDTQPIIKW